MISVHNLYWILWKNLLEPAGLDCWYYYPFGTTQNLSQGEYHDVSGIHVGSHVLFHYDQEPLMSHTLGDIYNHHEFWSNKVCKILANSEHSEIKKHICHERGMLDWYFFFHGFAALYWYADAKYLDINSVPDKVFLSLNHLVKGPRSFRMALVARLLDHDIAKYGNVSFLGTMADCATEITDSNSKLDTQEKHLIKRHLIDAQRCPIIVDSDAVDGTFSAHFGHQELALWQKSFWHVVTETVFYDDKLHLTEKVFKPIVASRPFLLLAGQGNLAYLRSYGFKTFGNWIDESYDLESDPHLRLQMIVQEINRLCAFDSCQLLKMHNDMTEILKFNRAHFFGKFREIIVDELLGNFDRCLRLWNNGRVYNQLPQPANLSIVKRILLGD